MSWSGYSQSEGVQPDSILQSLIKSKTDTSITIQKENDYLEAPVYYPARDSTVMSFEDGKIRLYGAAEVKYQEIILNADYIEISIDNKEVYASGLTDSLGKVSGRPTFKQGEETYEAGEIRYNFASKKAYVVDVVTKEDQGLLHSHITKRFPDGTLNIRDGKFTTCDADQPHFYFSISKGKMVPEKSMVSGPAYLVVEDIPLYFIGLPFGYFPQKRQKTSGLIMPQYGYEVNRGYYLRNGGWFFALNDNFDLKLTGDIYSKGSWKSSALTNYSKRYKFRGSFDFSYAKNVTGERDLQDYGQYKSGSDFSVRWAHNQDPKAHPLRTFNANVNLSSSSFDKYNSAIDNTAAYLTNTKSSSISYNRKFNNPLFNFTAKLGHTQNSRDTSIVLNLPSAAFTVNRFYPFKRKVRVGKQKWYEKIDMRYSSSFENKIKAKENQLFTKDFQDSLPSVLDNMQTGFKHDIPMTATFKLIPNMNLTPSLNYQGLLYFYKTQMEWDPEELEVIETRINEIQYVHALSPNINLTYNPQITGFYNFKKGKVQVIRHVMKPSLSASYRPDLGFDDSRYYQTYQSSESGRISESSIYKDGLYSLPNVAGQYGSVNFNLGNNLEMKVLDEADSTGQKLKKVKLIEDMALSTSYNIFADSLNLNPIRLTARTRVLNNVNINFSSSFDPYTWIQVQDGSITRQIRMNQFEINQTGAPARLSNASLSVGFQLPMKTKSKSSGGRSPGSFYEENGVDYGFPWNVRLDYSFRYDKLNPFVDSKITQTLRFSGKFDFSNNWKFTYSSGYDFVSKQLTYTNLAITRQLHCWQMTFNIIPFGDRKSYTFQINVVDNLFKDVKFRKEKSWFDSENFF